MNKTEYLLQVLTEEAAEVQQAASKFNRFGAEDFNPKTGIANRDKLIDELNELVAMTEMLEDIGVLPVDWIDNTKLFAKKERVTEYMEYSRELGCLNE